MYPTLGEDTCLTNGMEWNGMEWNGMEWNGMEWNGTEQNGMRDIAVQRLGDAQAVHQHWNIVYKAAQGCTDRHDDGLRW